MRYGKLRSWLVASVAIVSGTIQASAGADAQGCRYFDPQTPSVEVVIKDAPLGPYNYPDPRVDVPLSIPVAYLARHNVRPGPQDGVNLIIKTADGSPLTAAERYDRRGRALSPRKMPSHANVLLQDTSEIEFLSISLLRWWTVNKEASSIGDFKLRDDEIAGLQTIDDTPANMDSGRSIRYVSVTDSEIETLLNCHLDGYYPNPQCEMRFDYRNLNIYSSFSATLAPEWANIRRLISRLVDCATTNNN